MDRPKCPQHGDTLCYGQIDNFKIYRCELGFAMADELGRVKYVQRTHREYWLFKNAIIEVKPHTKPNISKLLEEILASKLD